MKRITAKRLKIIPYWFVEKWSILPVMHAVDSTYVNQFKNCVDDLNYLKETGHVLPIIHFQSPINSFYVYSKQENRITLTLLAKNEYISTMLPESRWAYCLHNTAVFTPQGRRHHHHAERWCKQPVTNLSVFPFWTWFGLDWCLIYRFYIIC